MHYYIDGYNLMFRMGLAGGDFKKDRETIISKIYERIELVELDVTLVFDAQYRFGLGSRTHLHFLEICFTDEGETADDYILNELRSCPTPRNETVITSDNRLAWRARRLHAHTESVEEFYGRLEKRFRKKLKGGAEVPRIHIVQPPVPVLGPIDPAPGDTLEESQGFYLLEFEKNLKKLMSEEQKMPKFKQLKADERKGETETARWERLFEERPNPEL